MTQRMNYFGAAPKALEPMLAIEAYIKASSLEPRLVHLVKTRASQINGCAYCLHMHTSDALAEGEAAARLFLLDAWEESGMYKPRERAALAWTETLTKVAETHAPDDAYEALKPHFSEGEIVDLTLLVATINSWNRIAIAFRGQHPNDRKLAA
jgi:AhpD family alkylhydroperoxidase